MEPFPSGAFLLLVRGIASAARPLPLASRELNADERAERARAPRVRTRSALAGKSKVVICALAPRRRGYDGRAKKGNRAGPLPIRRRESRRAEDPQSGAAPRNPRG